MNHGRIAIKPELLSRRRRFLLRLGLSRDPSFLKLSDSQGVGALPADARIVTSYRAGDMIWIVVSSEQKLPTVITIRYAPGQGPQPLDAPAETSAA